MLALKQWFHLLRERQQVHVQTDHESLCYLERCPQQLTPRQARWSHSLEEYNLTLWHVPGLENPAADACFRLTSRQLMDFENATRTRAFLIPLVENSVSPEGELVTELLHVLEDSFSHDEVWPEPYDHLYVSLRSRRSVMFPKMQNKPTFSTLIGLSSQRTCNHCRPTRLWLRIHTSLRYISMMLATRYKTCRRTPTTLRHRIGRHPSFGKELPYAPTSTELIRCRRHPDGTLQPVALPKVGPKTPYLSSLKGTHHRVHRHYQCKDLTSTEDTRQRTQRYCTAAPAAHACACSVGAPLFFFSFFFQKKKIRGGGRGTQPPMAHAHRTQRAHW